MTDEVVRLSMIGQVLRGRWLALTAITIAGALVGAAASLVVSPGYTTTSQVLLRGQQADTVFDAQAELATSSTVLDRAAAALGWEATGADLRDSVDAEVSEGGLLEITGAADTPRAAQQLTDQVATEYVTFANELITTTTDASTQVRLERLEALRQQVEITNQQINRLHRAATQGDLTLDTVRARTELESLRNDLAEAMSQLDEAAASPGGQEPLVIGPAAVPTSTAPPTMAHLAAGGAAVFLLLGGFGFLLAARADTRLRDSSEIGAALGVPVSGTLPVPDERVRPKLLWWRSHPQPATDDPGDDPQVRRVLHRLAAHDDRPLLLVAADDDPLAHRAVTRLAMAAGADETRRTVLRIAHIDPEQPVLDVVSDDVGGAVLVISAGTRTGWELVGISLACTDAGHALAGSVLAQRATRPATSQASQTAAEQEQAVRQEETAETGQATQAESS
ncbi:exopolysaccharide biosynthesis protein [Haloechinothrix salitolerans]|uniref:Exopolysaccharide biosynthesis protein n=1 Tax=Haloechinothrix salitolerans TaxID=926830 RepID=A0ABW2C3G4_9PSEU